MNREAPQTDLLRVSVHEHEIHLLMEKYAKLSRTEVLDVIARLGPMRADVERELERICAMKR